MNCYNLTIRSSLVSPPRFSILLKPILAISLTTDLFVARRALLLFLYFGVASNLSIIPKSSTEVYFWYKFWLPVIFIELLFSCTSNVLKIQRTISSRCSVWIFNDCPAGLWYLSYVTFTTSSFWLCVQPTCQIFYCHTGNHLSIL